MCFNCHTKSKGNIQASCLTMQPWLTQNSLYRLTESASVCEDVLTTFSFPFLLGRTPFNFPCHFLNDSSNNKNANK